MSKEKKHYLQDLLDHLQLSAASFSKSLGYDSPNKIYYILRFRNGVSIEVASDIIKIYPHINRSWLLTGEGEMIRSDKTIEAKQVMPQFDLAPLVGQYAYAGYLSGFADVEYMESLPKRPIIREPEYNGEYLCFEARGDSMDDGSSDSVKEGDLLVCRPISKDLWRYKLPIHNNKNFVIVHKTDGIVIKKIIHHNIDSCEIIIHSLNPMYKDKVLSLNDITQIFIVYESIRK